MKFVIKTKNGRYFTCNYGYSKDIQKSLVYENGLYWGLGPNEEVVEVTRRMVIEEVVK